jgi:hypothetical protein
MVEYEPRCVDELKSTDVLKSVVAALKTHVASDADAVSSACLFLVAMLKSSVGNATRTALLELSVCETALEALALHGGDSDKVVKATCKLLLHLLPLANTPFHASQLGNSDTLAKIGAILKAKPDISDAATSIKKVLLALEGVKNRGA